MLKGVVRVEALATPSEHIPALMERVKPVYLSRTYGIQLPNADDASKNWDAETFLDKMARMKGRLLKGGEPDLDSVAKIMLSDWVRGRIPYFVSPPERSDTLNQAEAKAAKRADVKGKGKGKATSDKERPIGVKQNLGSIMQKNTFVGEDIKSLEEAGLEVGDEDEDEAENDGVTDDGDDAEGNADEGGELAWNDVFPGDEAAQSVQEEREAPTVFSKLDLDEDEDEDEDDVAKESRAGKLTF